VPRAIPRALTVGSIAQAADESADIAVIVEGAGAVYTICGRSRPSACTNVHELHTAAIALGGTVQVNVSAFWAFHLRFSSLNGKTSCQLCGWIVVTRDEDCSLLFPSLPISR